MPFSFGLGGSLDATRRCSVIRDVIGDDCWLMTDANQRWDVGEAIANMRRLAPFRPKWIEEPTSPDDVLGHAAISAALAPLGIGVATGEACQNRVIFKQLFQAKVQTGAFWAAMRRFCNTRLAPRAGHPVLPD